MLIVSLSFFVILLLPAAASMLVCKVQEGEDADEVQHTHSTCSTDSVKEYSIRQVLEKLADLTDADSGTSVASTALRTAEALREQFPGHGWLHLAGLLHVMGKVMFYFGQPRCNVMRRPRPVGDIHREHCGLDSILMDWGYAEYMHTVLVENGCTLSATGLGIVRYHRFDAWLKHNEFARLTNVHDRACKRPWLIKFNEIVAALDIRQSVKLERVWWYYELLCGKYNIPGTLMW